MDQFLARFLGSLLLALVVVIPLGSDAERIDATHYRFCVMDDGDISDEAFINAYDISPAYLGDMWFAYDCLINGDETSITNKFSKSSINVLMSEVNNDAIVNHRWKYGNGGIVYNTSTTIHICVDAPTGIILQIRRLIKCSLMRLLT